MFIACNRSLNSVHYYCPKRLVSYNCIYIAHKIFGYTMWEHHQYCQIWLICVLAPVTSKHFLIWKNHCYFCKISWVTYSAEIYAWQRMYWQEHKILNLIFDALIRMGTSSDMWSSLDGIVGMWNIVCSPDKQQLRSTGKIRHQRSFEYIACIPVNNAVY